MFFLSCIKKSLEYIDKLIVLKQRYYKETRRTNNYGVPDIPGILKFSVCVLCLVFPQTFFLSPAPQMWVYLSHGAGAGKKLFGLQLIFVAFYQSIP